MRLQVSCDCREGEGEFSFVLQRRLTTKMSLIRPSATFSPLQAVDFVSFHHPTRQ